MNEGECEEALIRQTNVRVHQRGVVCELTFSMPVGGKALLMAQRLPYVS